tara:strand:- start:477 stop:659 length:183 start_codon:yes stop_codon:yes gene_type:complete
LEDIISLPNHKNTNSHVLDKKVSNISQDMIITRNFHEAGFAEKHYTLSRRLLYGQMIETD